MNFTIKNIEINNFITYEHQKLDLDDKGLILIVGNNLDEPWKGKNSCGKTLISDAILWLLTGETSRNILSDSVIGKFGRSCHVSGNFIIGDSEVRIDRYRKDPKYGNSFKIIEKNIDMSHRKIKNTEERLEDVIGCSLPLLKLSCFQHGDITKHFSRLKPNERSKIIDEIVGASDANIPDRYKKINKMIREYEIDTEKLYTSNALNRQKLSSFEDSIKSNIDSIEDQKNNIPKETSNIKSINTVIVDYSEEIKKAKELLNENKEKEDKLKTISCSIDELENQKSKYERSKRDKEVIARGIVLHVDVEKGEICDKCGNIVKEEKINKMINDRKEKHNLILLEVEKINKIILRLNDKIRAEDDNKKELKKDFEEPYRIELKINSLEESKEKQLEDLEREELHRQTIDKIKEDNIRIINKLEDRNKDNVIQVGLLKNKITKNNFKIWRLNYKLDLLSSLSSFYSPTGFRPMVMDYYAPVISECSNFFFKDFTNGKGEIIISNRSQSATGKVLDKVEIKVKENDEEKHFPEEWSLGEGGCIDISLNAGIMRLASTVAGKNFNFLSLDEITNGLSNEWILVLLDILKTKFVKPGATVLMTSHMPIEKHNFDKIWNVIKENGRSRVEVEDVI